MRKLNIRSETLLQYIIERKCVKELEVRSQTYYIIKLDNTNFFQELTNDGACYTFNFSFAKRYRCLENARKDVAKLKEAFSGIELEIFEIKMKRCN